MHHFKENYVASQIDTIAFTNHVYIYILSYPSPKTNNYIQINELKVKGTTKIYFNQTPHDLIQSI